MEVSKKLIDHVDSNASQGGYLFPEVIKIHKPGMIARIARFFNRSSGWQDYRFGDELRKQIRKKHPIRKTASELSDDWKPPIPISTRTNT